MRVPDIHLKCPAGPHTRRCSRAMAHRRGLLRGKVTLTVLATLVLGLLLAGSVFISNQTTGLPLWTTILPPPMAVLGSESSLAPIWLS